MTTTHEPNRPNRPDCDQGKPDRPAHDNRCDVNHPEQGNDHTVGHHNPDCAPLPTPAPAPKPQPVPAPTPAPHPTPAPVPHPAPQPAPEPAPAPTPAPAPVPVVLDTQHVDRPAPVTAPAPAPAPVCVEDMPCWNCATMGNHLCGPTTTATVAVPTTHGPLPMTGAPTLGLAPFGLGVLACGVILVRFAVRGAAR